MKPIVASCIAVLISSSLCSAQQDLLPAFPGEIIGDGQEGSVAIFKGNNRPFTGILVDQKTNKRLGEFKDGYRNGVFRAYYSNGTKKEEGRFANGLKTGPQIEWFVSGSKRLECSYLNGLKEGGCTEWFSNNQQKSSYLFAKDSIVDGEYSTYLESGSKDGVVTYKDGEAVKTWKYVDGRLSETSELIVDRYPNGQKRSSGHLINSKKEGLWTNWYEHPACNPNELCAPGEGQKSSEGFWKDGSQDGHWVTWFGDGKKEFDGEYKNGKRDGIGTLYNYTEHLTYEGGWKDGLREGKGTVKWWDGTLNYQGEFKNGVPDGHGTTYDKMRKVYDGEWKNGKFNGEGEWTPERDGSFYRFSGVFINGSLEGQGTLNEADTDGSTLRFTGEWKDGKMFNGLAYSTLANGKKAVTEFKDGKKGETKRTKQ